MARLKTPISYYGGKQMLLKHILPLIPEHTLYTEAFCGGCAVLFAKPPAQCEVINDTNTELVNFYRVAQTQYAALKAMIDGTFEYDRSGTTTQKLRNAKEAFTEELCSRLGRVTVECEDGIDVIRRYDCPEAFHFIDPPYVGSDCGHYNGTFDEEDFSRLLDTLATVEGKFMLTMFPHEKIERFAAQYGWTIHRLDRTITASKVSRRRQEEWITTNY
ncbi:DNA adenine methylase [Alistipes communis]|uniref:DNA adenine methylase n=1 Tax=Alistipes communis TaxID=2585118 RepID=UPI00320BA524